MSSRWNNDRLQPCLLDRLTDPAPWSREEGREERVMSMRRYRESVKRDLMWLFNAAAHPEGHFVHEFPEVRLSVANFGFRSLCGLTRGEVNLEETQRSIAELIRTFEPRIAPDSLKVRPVDSDEALHRLQFEIEGDLWAHPVPEHIWLKTSVDLDTGRFIFGDRLNE